MRVRRAHENASDHPGPLSLLAEAEEVRKLAKADRNWPAVLGAIKEKGILSGKRIERSEKGAPGEFDWREPDRGRVARDYRDGRGAAAGWVPALF